MKLKISIKFSVFILISTGLFIIGGCSTAAGEVWKLIFIEENGSELYIDTDSIIHLEENVVRVWEKTTTRRPSDRPTLFLIDMDCHFQTFRTLQSIPPKEDTTSQATFPNKWEPLDSIKHREIRDRLYKALCGSQLR